MWIENPKECLKVTDDIYDIHSLIEEVFTLDKDALFLIGLNRYTRRSVAKVVCVNVFKLV